MTADNEGLIDKDKFEKYDFGQKQQAAITPEQPEQYVLKIMRDSLDSIKALQGSI